MTDLTLVNRSLKLAASVHGAENAPPLLFLHGLALSRDTWEEGVARLGQSFQVWTLDFRGHGHSDYAAGYALADYVSDALTALARSAARRSSSAIRSAEWSPGRSLNPPIRSFARSLLEDPPWFLGDRAVFEGSPFPKLFAGLRARQTALREANAPLAAYVEFVAGAPSSAGGLARDHRRRGSFSVKLRRCSEWTCAAGTASPARLPARRCPRSRRRSPSCGPP